MSKASPVARILLCITLTIAVLVAGRNYQMTIGRDPKLNMKFDIFTAVRIQTAFFAVSAFQRNLVSPSCSTYAECNEGNQYFYSLVT